MHIGLYDIDLWHYSNKVYPNLELAKVANYHRQQGDMVTMLTPKTTNEGRFDKIIYFKERHGLDNSKLVLSGPKKEIYGQGFYNRFYPLDDKYTNSLPDYLVYEPYFDKLNKSFKDLKRNSHIRIENKDLTYYHKDKLNLYIADINYFSQPAAFEILDDFKNHRFYFVHGTPITNLDQFDKFLKFKSLFRTLVKIDFPYDAALFKEYYNSSKLIFPIGDIRQGETENHATLRAAAQVLFLKANDKTINSFGVSRPNSLLKDIVAWGRSRTKDSFFNFYSSNKEIINKLLILPPETRFLLKASPKDIDSSNFDFFETL